MADSLIRWKKGDAIRLGKAVADFNRKIKELEKQEDSLYLPEKLVFAKEKENITTRKELNRKINSLKRFMREGAEKKYITEAGEEITKWERAELGIMSRTAQVRIKKELGELYKPLKRKQIFKGSNGI